MLWERNKRIPGGGKSSQRRKLRGDLRRRSWETSVLAVPDAVRIWTHRGLVNTLKAGCQRLPFHAPPYPESNEFRGFVLAAVATETHAGHRRRHVFRSRCPKHLEQLHSAMTALGQSLSDDEPGQCGPAQLLLGQGSARSWGRRMQQGCQPVGSACRHAQNRPGYLPERLL
eukprot:scaffold7381_cov310-Pinguiococcus_pyrenoidosus.AAC.78